MVFSTLFKHWTYQLFSPGSALRKKYEAFKDLLAADNNAHELLAELEEVYYHDRAEDFCRIEKRYADLAGAVSSMIQSLERMKPGPYASLSDYFRKFDFYIKFFLAPPEFYCSPPYTLSLSQLPDFPKYIGGKAKTLGILSTKLGVPVPDGFAITINSFNSFIEYNQLRPRIDGLLTTLDIRSLENLNRISEQLSSLIYSASMPPDVEESITTAFDSLEKQKGKKVMAAVRSSAQCEDGESSFAGQFRTVLNVSKDTAIHSYKEVLASKYSPEALYYRISRGFTDAETPMSVLVQEMVTAQSSGVMYTDEVMRHQERAGTLSIHSIWGLGELLVSGATAPDTFLISKSGEPLIIEKNAAEKIEYLVPDVRGVGTKPLPAERRKVYSISDSQALQLADWGIKLEKFFGQPQDIEWCLDSDQNLYILQSRPLRREVVYTEEGTDVSKARKVVSISPLLDGCERASGGVACGIVYQVSAESPIDKVPAGSILVIKSTPPSYVKVLDRLAAVVADQGSRAGHFSSVAREFGVPLLVHTTNATALLTPGKTVTVDADGGAVYDGRVNELLQQEIKRPHPTSPFRLKMKQMMDFISPLNLVDPSTVEFVPESCRSMHDIIRFAHEKAVQEMFATGDRGLSTVRGAKRLISRLPMTFFVLDVGGGVTEDAVHGKEVTFEQVTCRPLQALWEGFTHPGVQWNAHDHFDWKTFDDVALAGGIARKSSAAFANYAVIGNDYLNLNMRFGYHFTIVDTLCSENEAENYCMLRFAGGGGTFAGKNLRLQFLSRILGSLGFVVEKKGDLLDARLSPIDCGQLLEKLDWLGRLLGATKLMDMVLKDEQMVDRYAEEFMKGRYHFLHDNPKEE